MSTNCRLLKLTCSCLNEVSAETVLANGLVQNPRNNCNAIGLLTDTYEGVEGGGWLRGSRLVDDRGSCQILSVAAGVAAWWTSGAVWGRVVGPVRGMRRSQQWGESIGSSWGIDMARDGEPLYQLPSASFKSLF